MKFQYLEKVAWLDGPMAMSLATLNLYGSEGWELTSVVPRDLERGKFSWFFKRQVKE